MVVQDYTGLDRTGGDGTGHDGKGQDRTELDRAGKQMELPEKIEMQRWRKRRKSLLESALLLNRLKMIYLSFIFE